MPTITAAANNELEIELGVEEIKFIDALKALPDPRDNRGKRHLLTIFNSHCRFCHLGWPIKRVRYSSLHDP
jgi:hypothetical protein